TNLLAGIASIALLVGGIGIMNMMLVSVTERTNEIGLRKALGAKPRSIQTQFLLESILLSLLGGLVGTALGVSVSALLCQLMSIPFSISAMAVGLGVGFSLLVGVAFGWAPARKASNLNPIDALRSM
ncbi:MAG: FtsX-like permease family protein, partial [Eubacteriales bacterium]|nr:FtsX-like permease family protein [Eubacteriales bacterium]